MLELSKSGVRIELALLGAEILTFKIFALKRLLKLIKCCNNQYL